MLKIGSVTLKNWLVMAPMAGITNLPFRLIAKRFGAGLVTTEMISAAGLSRAQKKTLVYLQSDPEEKPLAVQLFGSDAGAMARAAEIVVDAGADIVDINMGCPAKKVVKTGAGGALLRTPEKARDIVAAVRKVCPVPLTAKIRAGWSPGLVKAWEIARLIEAEGADAITIHPRFVVQGFAGEADWQIITRVKEELRIPVIGNGDVFKPVLALRMKRQTGCDGVMIGRGAIGNPWIFSQILSLENGHQARPPELQERRALVMNHFNLLSRHLGQYKASKIMRGLLLWYTKGLPHSSRFRGAFTGIKDLDSLIRAMDDYFLTLEEKRV